MKRKEPTMANIETPRSTADFPTLDDFLDQAGTRETFKAIATEEVLAWQIARATKAQS
jgi:hypothetical protein